MIYITLIFLRKYIDSLKEQQTTLRDGIYPTGVPNVARVSVVNLCIYILVKYIIYDFDFFLFMYIFVHHTTSLGGCGK